MTTQKWSSIVFVFFVLSVSWVNSVNAAKNSSESTKEKMLSGKLKSVSNKKSSQLPVTTKVTDQRELFPFYQSADSQTQVNRTFGGSSVGVEVRL